MWFGYVWARQGEVQDSVEPGDCLGNCQNTELKKDKNKTRIYLIYSINETNWKIKKAQERKQLDYFF